MGVGAAVTDKKVLDIAYDAMTDIAGQKPVFTLARKSIATFRLREGMPIGCMVTLRRQRMYEFLDRWYDRIAPSSRLSRDQPQGVRRSWQLQHGPERAVGVPRVEPRQIHASTRHDDLDGHIGS